MQSGPATKKQKTTAKKNRVRSIDDFSMGDVHIQPIIKRTMCNIVPLSYTSDTKSAVLVQLSGGGSIPVAFGIDDKETDGRRKVRVSLQVDSESDHDQLVRLHTELVGVAATHWERWYPDVKPPLEDTLQTLCSPFVSLRKKKTNGDEQWPGITKAAVEPADCANGRCKIVDQGTGDTILFDQLPGMLWHKAIFELQYIYIQSTQSFGVTKKLRYLSCSEGDICGDTVSI